MKKIVNIVSLLVISLMFTACGNRVAFKTQKPLENAALVYVYVTDNISTEEGDNRSDYAIRINGKQFLQRVVAGEYLAFNLKTGHISISATRKQIEEKTVTLDLKAGQIYYLKISDNLDGGNFDFEIVNNSEGSKEVALTGQAGTSVDSPENIITELISSPEDDKSAVIVKESKMDEAKIDAIIEKKLEQRRLVTPVQKAVAPTATSPVSTGSKLQEIQKAFQLKEKGILNDAEFQKIKTEILSK